MSPEQSKFRKEMIRKAQQVLPDHKIQAKGFGFVVHRGAKDPITVYLDNMFRMVRHEPEPADKLINRWLEGLRQRASGQGENMSFDAARGDLFLAIRPVQTYELADGGRDESHLPPPWPVTVDLAVYLMIDLGPSVRYVNQGDIESWNTTQEEVTRIAYDNTVKTEQETSVLKLSNAGVIVSSGSRFESLGHLLYWPPNLQRVLSSNIPELSDEPLLLSVPVPFALIMTSQRFLHNVVEFQKDLYEKYGRLISRSIHVFKHDRIVSKVSHVVGNTVTCIGIEEYGLGSEIDEDRPFIPEDAAQIPA